MAENKANRGSLVPALERVVDRELAGLTELHQQIDVLRMQIAETRRRIAESDRLLRLPWQSPRLRDAGR